MNEDHLIRTGVLGRPRSPSEMLHEPLTKMEELTFGVGSRRCGFTGRVYESGSGARSQQEQTEQFIAQQAAENDRALPGDVCPYSGQPLDASIGALPRSIQIANFFAALPEETKLGWFQRAEALAATVTQGNA